MDIAAIEEMLSALSRIADQHGDQVSGIDLNPVAVTEDGGIVILDAAVFTSSGSTIST